MVIFYALVLMLFAKLEGAFSTSLKKIDANKVP